ncbi:phospholipase D, partial [Auriscalpium vulgare]
SQSVFRIECEYVNGAARWVIYRQLRDFLSLHTHYAVSNAYNRNVDTLPEFPKTSLPYFKFLKKESKEKGKEVGRADFARLQREALENYLLSLIRAVMFHSTSNRLAGFLEISSLFISQAQSGGSQYKAGYLKIEVSGSKGGGFGRKSVGRKRKRDQKWCAIRESYLVAVEELGETTVWDVFLLDPDFKIERPMRYYRQGLNLLQVPERHSSESKRAASEGAMTERSSVFGSIRSKFSKVLHSRHSTNGDAARESTSTRPRSDSVTSEGSSSSSSTRSGAQTPMLDPSTNTNPLMDEPQRGQKHSDDSEKKKKKKASEVSKHTFYIENSQMRLKLFARSERQMLQWIAALEKIASNSHYTGGNRFDSFAPIRLNVAAQWLVDGRDYFWNLSRAILLAKDTIYIHDWWISPELLMRRPGKPKYRLDRLLEKKAKEGVKIFIIVYQEVSSRTTPVDSNYTKQRLTNLHPNIMVQRSPSHFQTGTFYWAHHEKLCVIDQTIAFMGGLDLCFGRWDTPQHGLVDDPEDGQEQIWPGEDYSNGRITDFHTLTKPDEDLHDRSKVPRMPWHDVGMQVVGQPARDLARHFIQRWNYLLRIKNHSRAMPFLLPPPEFRAGELTQLGLTGTCELQICRSAGPWSLGTPDRIEHSIQNAYLKAIQLSDHFVYIENQFFITSTVVDDIAVENKIGDAIVHRIIRAHREGTPWKCCVVIPLLPGFPFPVDHGDASSVRIILECQNRTIGRGPNSIFARLRQEGIDPDEYFSVFSLRNWAKLKGDILTTELVYIHGKVCIVDDRLAIIGSANINERSQRGDRDSELAAVIRDTDMIDGTMAGKPYKVGRFAHSLRVRLMREHIGVDVDALDEEDLMANDATKPDYEQEEWDPDAEQRHGEEAVTTKSHPRENWTRNVAHMAGDTIRQVAHGSEDVGSKLAVKAAGKVGLKKELPDARTADVTLQEERHTYDRETGEKVPGFADSMVPTLEEKTIAEHRPTAEHAYGTPIEENPEAEKQEAEGTAPPEARVADDQLYGAPADASKSPATDDEPPHARSGKDDADAEEQKAPHARSILRKHLTAKLGQGPWTLPTPAPKIDADGFEDPISDSFWKDVWVSAAVHNTEIFRRVFHAVPDDLVTTWKQYKEFISHHERLNKPMKDESNPEHPDPVARVPSEATDEKAPEEQGQGPEPRAEHHLATMTGSKLKSQAQEEGPHNSHTSLASGQEPVKEANGQSEKTNGAGGDKKDASAADSKGKKVKGEPPFTKQERDDMEALLSELCGHLVLYPTRFLEGEDVANNFLFNADRLMPLPIYD